ncbi:MAG: serine/threonine protein kinase [Gemmataceae bacterium]
MTNTELGACEPFLYELRRSNLIERGQLDQVIEDFLRRQPHAEPNALAEHLVAQNVLTQFQAERILQGKTQGLVLGPYILTDAIGQGSMGVVHRGQSKTDGRCYAVKVLPRRSMWNVRLARRQVRSFAQFQHPTVVPFVDVGTSGGLHYLVWPFVEGETLEAMVQKNGQLDAGTTAQIGLQIATGLNTTHQHGLFHGLLKPSNVMLSPGPQVRILDFGIGSLLAENEGESLVDTMSTANTLTSGLDCCCPESIMEPTNRTPAGDQYSLGCVLYYCLTGRYPFPEGSAVEKMMAHQFKQPTALAELAPDTPPALVALIERLMMKKPEERFPAIDEAVEALHPLAGRLPAEPVELPPPRQLPGSNTPAMRPLSGSSMLMRPLPASNTPALRPLPGSNTPMPAPTPVPVNTPTPPPKSMRPSYPPPVAQLAPVITPTPVPAPLPTRRSLRGEVPVVPPPAHLPVHVAPPAAPAPRPAAAPRATQFQMPPDQYAEPAGGSAGLGPVGFLAIGAAVAVVCFLLMNTLLK